MTNLPKAKYKVSKQRADKFSFGGINHREGARDGEIYDCLNISTEEYPSLTVRNGRDLIWSLPEGSYGMGNDDRLFYCAEEDGKAYFYYDGERFFEVEKSEKNFAVINKYICVFPDKKYFSLWERESRGNYATLTELQESTLNDDTLKDGDIYTVGTNPPYAVFQFNSQGRWRKVKRLSNDTIEEYAMQDRWIYLLDTYGDMGGKVSVAENSSSSYIRIIENGDTGLKQIIYLRAQKAKNVNWMRAGDYLRIKFYLDSATSGEKTVIYYGELLEKKVVTSSSEEYVSLTFDTEFSGTGILAITIERVVPKLDFAFSHDNRLWGVDGDEIHASALGNPFNYNNYGTLSTSAWAVSVLSGGEFTGAIDYNGYPTFFKEDSLVRVGGDYPSQYTTYETKDIQGVMKGCHKSLAIANGILYYLSPRGVMSYTGSYPYSVGDALGEKLSCGVGGTSGDKYYLATTLSSGDDVIYIYDTKIRAWVKESAGKIIDFARLGGKLFFMSEDGIYLIDGEDSEEKVESSLEFAPVYDSSLEEKGVSGIYLSCRLKKDAHLRLKISYDEEDFVTVWEKEGRKKRNIFNVPLVIKRCNTYRLRLEGTGKYTIYAIGRERYYG